MSMLRVFLARLRAVLTRAWRDADLDDEIQAHLDLLTRDYVRRGLSLEAARTAARRDFGGVTQITEIYRGQRGFARLESFRQDLRFGLRSLARRPLLVLTATASIGIAAGLNITVYSVLAHVLFDTNLSGAPRDDRLVAIDPEASFLDYEALRTTAGFVDLAAMQVGTLVWRTDRGTERLGAKIVSTTFFDVLGVRAAYGRTFNATDSQVVLLDFGFWQRRFAGDPTIIGRPLNLNGAPFAVAGILPRNFSAPVFPLIASDLYVPISPLVALGLSNRAARQFDLIGRLHDGVTPGQANAALRVRATEVARESGQAGLARAVGVRSISGFEMWRQMGVGGMILGAAGVLYAVVALVLLVACANVAGLLLARAEERRREITVCAALGATRWRLAQRFIAEGAIVAVLGCAAGIALYKGTFAIVSSLAWTSFGLNVMPPSLPVLYCLLVAVALTVACSAAPALTVSRVAPGPALATLGPRATPRRSGLRRLLVVVQVAVCCVLMIGAFLLLRGFIRMQGVDPGFDVARTLWLDVRLPVSANGVRESEGQGFARIRSRLERVAGVESVSCLRYLPLTVLGWRASLHMGSAVDTHFSADIHPVGPSYLSTMGIPLLRGREFVDADVRGSVANTPIVVNDTLARRFFPSSDPIGQWLVLESDRGDGPERRLQIVGVARDSKLRSLNEDAHPVLYMPEIRTSFVVRVTGVATAAMRGVEQAVADGEPGASVQATPMSAHVANATRPVQLGSAVLAGLSGLGLLMAMTGLYAVVMCSVNERTFEIGIRIALGASGATVMRMVLRDALLIVGMGCALGGAAGLVLARLLSPLLAGGQRAADPVAFGAAITALLIVSFAASLVPAVRASRADPLLALRQE